MTLHRAGDARRSADGAVFNGLADDLGDHLAAHVAFSKNTRCLTGEVKNCGLDTDSAFSAVQDEVGFALGLFSEVVTNMLSGCRTDLAEGVGARGR